MSEEPTNYLTIENGVNIINCSSQMPNCPGKNLLSSDRKAIWLTAQGLPQSFTIDLTNQLKRPKFYNCFGLDCWHDYASNPSMIELLISTDGDEFITWTMIHPELRAGVQLFQIDPLGTRYNFIKVVIRETYGAPKTYINQIFLFEDNPLKTMASVSRGNESMLNHSNVMNTRKDSTLEEGQYNDHFMENFGQGQHLGSNIKPKLTQPSTDDFEFLQLVNQKPVNFNDHQTSVKKRPPSGTIHSSSASKLDNQQNNQNRFVQNRNDQEYPMSQRPPIAMQNQSQSAGLPLYPQQEMYEQKMNNMTHESGFYQNQEGPKQLSRRNSYGNMNVNQNPQYGGNEYNQMSFDLQQKPPIGNQAKIYSSSPARGMQNPNYNRPPYGSAQQNQPYFPPDQLNDSFGSVNDKISNMNEEVKKLVHSKSMRSSEENFRPNAKNNVLDEEETNLPLLTQSEKEVKNMKKEMQKWGGMMSSLQDNMAKLLTKVSDMQTNMDNVKTKVHHMQGGERGSETVRNDNETRRSVNSAEKSLGDQLGTHENFETLRSQITSYLENVMNQNQLIIQENQKLRQNVEQHRSIPPSSSKRVFEKDELEMTNNQSGWNPVELEKTISAVFEKNMKAWENSIFKRIKSQNSTLEERISEKLTSEFENMREENESFKHKVDEDLKQLKLKVGYLEQANLKATSELSSYRLSEEQPANTLEYKRRTKPLLPNKENVAHYQNQNNTKRPIKDVSSVDARKPKVQQQLEDSSRDQPLANSSTSSLNKIQNLMDKLNQKIALRDRKVQILQHQISNPSSQTGKEALNSSGESLEESLFNKKTRNNVSARKKVMK